MHYIVLLCFRSKMLNNQLVYYVFARKCWNTFRSHMLNKKNMVSLGFRSTMFNNHVFYYAFAHKCWETSCFILCSFSHVENTRVFAGVASDLVQKFKSALFLVSLCKTHFSTVFCFTTGIAKPFCECFFGKPLLNSRKGPVPLPLHPSTFLVLPAAYSGLKQVAHLKSTIEEQTCR